MSETPKTFVLPRKAPKGLERTYTNNRDYPVTMRRYQSSPIITLLPGGSVTFKTVPKGKSSTWEMSPENI